MGLLRRLLRRRPKLPEPLTVEEYFVRFPDFRPGPETEVPKGIRVRQYDPDMDVYWPSWAAWRFAQGSPEYVRLRDVPSGMRDAHIDVSRDGYKL